MENISKTFSALAGLDGFSSGVGAPTRTTSTFTPTTLRNIEQTFLEYNNEVNHSTPYQAGFVPPVPLPPAYQSLTDQESHSMDSNSVSNSSWHTTSPPLPSDDLTTDGSFNNSVKNNNNNSQKATSRRNMGGRRPNKPTNISPEEEEKRRVRRERNKLAAARCRRRREDYTNELLKEVDALETKKKSLQSEVQELQREKEDIDLILETHRMSCKQQIRPVSPLELKPFIASALAGYAGKIKQEPLDSCESEEPPMKRMCFLPNNPNHSTINNIQTTMTSNNVLPSIQSSKPSRPNTLNVQFAPLPSQNFNTLDTPNSCQFNFESLMEGGTGLTPINGPLKAISDGIRNGMDLITPTGDNGTSKLCSL